MYLVEEFKDALHLKLPLRSLEQAISNVQASIAYTNIYTDFLLFVAPPGQVIDEFSVHRTADIRESVAYLTLLTRQLQHHYAVSNILFSMLWVIMTSCVSLE